MFNRIGPSGGDYGGGMWKDCVAIEQLLLGGVTALAYYGTVSDLDVTVAGPAQTRA